MAAPVDAGRVITQFTSATTTWTTNLPGSIVAGDLLVLLARTAGAQNYNPPGFTLIDQDFTDASDDIMTVHTKWADGTEGATVAATVGANEKGCVIAYRITGARNPTGNAVATIAIGTTANANPAAATLAGAPDDYLIICWLGLDGETQTFTSPSGYSAATTANSGTGGAVASNCRMASCSKQLTAASSEDPGAWTSTAPASGFCSYTITIRQPAPAVPNLGARRSPARRAMSRFLTAR